MIIIIDEEGPTNTIPQIDSGPTATPNPLFADETAELSVKASDGDGDPLTFTWSTLSGEAIITGTGDTVTYSPSIEKYCVRTLIHGKIGTYFAEPFTSKLNYSCIMRGSHA